MEHKENDTKKKRSPYMSTKSMLSIRMLAGAYLVYLSYEMIGDLSGAGETDRMLMIIFAAIFTICGAVLVITSGLNIHNQYYIGSPLYPSKSSEELEELEDAETTCLNVEEDLDIECSDEDEDLE